MNRLVELFKVFLIETVEDKIPELLEEVTLESLNDLLGALEAQPHLEELFEVMQGIEEKGEPVLKVTNKDEKWPNTAPHACQAATGNHQLFVAGELTVERSGHMAIELFRAIAAKLETGRVDYPTQMCEGWLYLDGAVELLPAVKDWFERGLNEAQRHWCQAQADLMTATRTEACRYTRNRSGVGLGRKPTTYIIISSEDAVSYRFPQFCSFWGGQQGRRTIVVFPRDDGFAVISTGMFLNRLVEFMPTLEVQGDRYGIARGIAVREIVDQIKVGIEAPSKRERERTERLKEAGETVISPDQGTTSRLRPQDLAMERLTRDKARHHANKRTGDGPTAVRPDTVLTGEPVERNETVPSEAQPSVGTPPIKPQRDRRGGSKPLTHNPFANLKKKD